MTAALVSLDPTLPLLKLSEQERELVGLLRGRIGSQKRHLLRLDKYYNGQQDMTTLGISKPPEMKDLRVVMGWPRLAVDAPHERLTIQGFRYPDALDADTDLWEIWQRNNLDSEAPLAFLDSLVFGRSFLVAGTDDDGQPLITVESPLNMAALWNPRTRHPKAVLQLYTDDDGTEATALYAAGQTVTLHQDGRDWVVVDRDEHGQPWPPVMMMTNRTRAHSRDGASEITPEVMDITDAGCRTLLDLEVSREFYAAPQRYILGAAESAFQDAQGNPKTAWETYRGRVLALERDEQGDVPQVGSFAAYDPSAYTKVIDTYAERMASITGLPSSYLGKTTDQPASADAIRMQTDRLVQKVRRMQKSFEHAWEGALRMAIAFRDGGIPDPSWQIETIWRSPEIPTPSATTDSVQKQIASGYLPPRSDVAGEMLGHSPNQRARISAEWDRADADKAVEAALSRVNPADRATGAAQRSTAKTRELDIVEMVQKVYLGVGKVITVNEARAMLDAAGANLGDLDDQQVLDLMLQNPVRASTLDADTPPSVGAPVDVDLADDGRLSE